MVNSEFMAQDNSICRTVFSLKDDAIYFNSIIPSFNLSEEIQQFCHKEKPSFELKSRLNAFEFNILIDRVIFTFRSTYFINNVNHSGVLSSSLNSFN